MALPMCSLEATYMKQIEVVGAVIVNSERQILCALRSAHRSLGGMWEFPGGKIEPGETHQQALVREIQEELGCQITVGQFITECLHGYSTVCVHLYTYYATISSGSPSPREHEKLEWNRVMRLGTLHWAPADLPTVQMVIQDLSGTD
jgi:8-oxo-dGTP diphosphatase